MIPVIVIAGTPLAVNDLTYHLRAGDIMFDTHAVLRTDVFSAVAYGKPWLNQQWLAQIVLATAFRLGGWFGLVALRALLGALVLSFVFLACRAAGAATKRAAWLTLASGVMLMGGFTLRPQLLGMGCFAVTAWLVARRRTHPEGVWIVIPITILWANLHGSFFLAPLLLGLAWVEDRVGTRTRSAHAARGRPRQPPRDDRDPVRLPGVVLRCRPGDEPGHPENDHGVAAPSIDVYTGAAFFLSVVVVAALLIARVRRPVPWGSLLSLVVFGAIALTADPRRVLVGHRCADRPCRGAGGPAGAHRTPGPRPRPQRRDRRPARVGHHRKSSSGGRRYTGPGMPTWRQARVRPGRDHA